MTGIHRSCAIVVAIVLTTMSRGFIAANENTTPVRRPEFAQKIKIKGVSDAGKLNHYVYRGAQPNKTGLKHLREMGIDTIIDMRAEFHWSRERERRHVEGLGMRYVNIPGNGWSPPSDAQMAKFFSIVKARPRHRIFVHCWLGGDRSGVFLAAYRIAFDGWTPEEALAEMHAFHFHAFWHPALVKYIRQFPARLRESSELEQYARAHSDQPRSVRYRAADGVLVCPQTAACN